MGWALLAFALATPGHSAEIAVADEGHVFNPSWSPDGSWLAFELNKYGGNIDLYAVRVREGAADGTPQKLVLPGTGSAFSSGASIAAAPVWHKQGLLIFEGSNAGGTNRLYYWSPGGQSAAELLSSGQVSGDLSWPTISPDGKTMAFVSDATGNGDLYFWDRAKNTVQRAQTTQFSEMAPNFASDNVQVAYSRKNLGGEDLFIWDGYGTKPLVGGNGDQSRPVWSGEAVVFFSNERGDDHWDIDVSDGTGAKKTLVKDVRLPLRSTPALTSDEQWVAYGVSDPDKANSIFFAKVDGSRKVAVNTGKVACGEPGLVEAGGRIYLAFTALPSDGADWRQLHVMDVTEDLR